MQFQCLIGLTLALTLMSCASGSKKLAKCDHETLFSRGLKDGELGLNYSESIEKLCPSENFSSAKGHYLSGRKKGLKNFCNAGRAQNRALLNLEVEEVCKDFEDYVVWFEKGLDKHCTKELALKDSQSLKPSNKNCMKISHYESAFKKELTSLCTTKWAYQQGYRELNLSPYCLNLDIKESLELSHKLGLESRLEFKNNRLVKKADRLRSEMKNLKKMSPNTREEKKLIKQRKEKVSRQLLETLHALEQNKSKL